MIAASQSARSCMQPDPNWSPPAELPPGIQAKLNRDGQLEGYAVQLDGYPRKIWGNRTKPLDYKWNKAVKYWDKCTGATQKLLEMGMEVPKVQTKGNRDIDTSKQREASWRMAAEVIARKQVELAGKPNPVPVQAPAAAQAPARADPKILQWDL